LIFARRGFVGLSLLGVAAPLLSENAWAQIPIWLVPTPPSGPLSATRILASVEGLYNQLSTFRASFKQRYSTHAYNQTKDSVGTVVFERPDKMSWTYAGSGNRVVSDGQLIRIYEKANQQMYVQPLSRSQFPVALSFLFGPTSNLSQSMTFSLQNAARMTYATGHVLMGVPLQPRSAFDRVYYYVDAKTFFVRRVVIQDRQQNRNRYDFGMPVLNSIVAPGTFVFTPPPGTQVITATGVSTVAPAPAQPIQP
jgi:outer membrane lipoprotein carrier protein